MNKRLVGSNQCCYITWVNNVTIVTDNLLTENQTKVKEVIHVPPLAGS